MTDNLNIEEPSSLLGYLRATKRIDSTETPVIRVLEGGVSNRTVLLEQQTGEDWVVKQALEKLRVTSDWRSSPVRIHREAAALRCLAELTPGATPEFVFEDFDLHILAMQAIPQPHENWKSMLLDGRLSDDHIRQFGELLGSIHLRAYERRASLSKEFSDRSFFESLRIEPYYNYTAQQIPATAAFYDSLISDTRRNAITLVHGDYSPKNVLVRQGRLVLLDHEVAHWGDPAFDAGFSLTHLLSKAHHSANRRSVFEQSARNYWQVYSDSLGDASWLDGLQQRAVRHLLGCMLARVEGRSPLEYLGPPQRAVQRDVVVDIMHAVPDTVDDVISEFIWGVEQYANN